MSTYSDAEVNPPAVHPQTPKPQSKTGCVTACVTDALVRAGIDAGTAEVPLAAALNLVMNQATGGINPVSWAFGYSAFQGDNIGVTSSIPGMGTTVTVTTGANIANKTGALSSIGRTLFSRDAGQMFRRAGVAVKGVGKYLPVIGIGVAIASFASDVKDCQKRCENGN